jgi:carbon storage regulator
MLILTRKKGQTVVIDGQIEVTLIAVQGEQVRLGINAPKQIPVHRKELLDEVTQQNIEAAAAGRRPPERLPAWLAKGDRPEGKAPEPGPEPR